MSAETVSSTDTIRVFVRLLGEGTGVYRPTMATLIATDVVRLLSPNQYDPEDEDWEFKPGALVRVEPRKLEGDDVIVATSAVE